MRPPRVVVAAGGTAGHVFPGLAVAARLAGRHGAEVLFVGRAEGQEARLVPEAGFPLATVAARPFVRRPSLAAVQAPVSAVLAARRARAVVRGADVVLGMGGYVSVPVSLAAWAESVPLVLHEQNAVLGLANRVAARWAKAVALSFGETAHALRGRARAVVTGNPVRDAILTVQPEREALAAEAAQALGLDPGRRTVAVFGGSQGALHLNRAALGAVRLLQGRADLQVLLITGPTHHPWVARAVPPGTALLVRAVPFVDRMELVYAAADLAVCRAGASTVAELAVAGLPALLVPYPYATARHQEANARALQRAGAASVLLDDQLEEDTLTDRMIELVDHPERLAHMRSAALALARPHAADAVAALAVEVAGRAEAPPAAAAGEAP